jgi:N-acylmannosamine kinase
VHTQETDLSPVIALDIGGTQSRAALLDGGRIAWRATAATPAQAGPEAMLATMVELLRPLQAPQAPVGVAIAGQVVDGCVTAHNDSLLRGWRAYPLEQALRQQLQRPVRVVNDARAAAWGEFLFGAGRGCDEFLFVTVSTGVGAGLVLNRRLHLSRNGMEAELGETLLPDGATLESLASGSALGRLAAALGHRDAPALCDAADAGDAQAEAALGRGIHALAAKLGDLTVMLGIQRTALGGGVGLRPGYVERLQARLACLPALHRHDVVRAQLGGDAGLHGVAALAGDPR